MKVELNGKFEKKKKMELSMLAQIQKELNR